MRIYAIKTNPHFFLQSIVKPRFTKIVASKEQRILAQIQTLYEIMKTLIILYLLFSQTTYGQQKARSQAWVSNHRNLSIQLFYPWTLMPILDTKTQTLVGVIDTSDGKSYIIQFFDDLPVEKLTNERYFSGIKKTMLEADGKNKVITEDSVLFHGKFAYRQTFLMYTKKWGILKQENYVIRTGLELISVQILFPFSENASSQKTPQLLSEFDLSVKLNGF